MRRREFITIVGGAAASWPLAARAQQPAMPVVAFLNSASPAGYVPMVAAFRQGLNESGYVEGQNVAVEYRWAEGQYDRVPVIALELVGRQVAVIVANTPGVLAVKAAVTTTPIVFTIASDPVQIGLVASMSRPGGNVTGATTLAVELAPKRLELAHELVPTASTIAALINPTNTNTAEAQLRDLRAAAHTLGLQLHVVHASTEREFDTAFANMAGLQPSALVIGDMASSLAVANSSLHWPSATRYRQSSKTVNLSPPAACWAMAAAFPTLTVWPGFMSPVFSKAKSLPSCQFSSRPRSRCS